MTGDADPVSKADSEYRTPLYYAAYYHLNLILDATHVGYKPEDYHSAKHGVPIRYVL